MLYVVVIHVFVRVGFMVMELLAVKSPVQPHAILMPYAVVPPVFVNLAMLVMESLIAERHALLHAILMRFARIQHVFAKMDLLVMESTPVSLYQQLLPRGEIGAHVLNQFVGLVLNIA